MYECFWARVGGGSISSTNRTLGHRPGSGLCCGAHIGNTYHMGFRCLKFWSGLPTRASKNAQKGRCEFTGLGAP